MMEMLFLTAIYASPMTLCVPPLKNLNTIVERMDELMRLWRENTFLRRYLRFFWTAFSNFLFRNFIIPAQY
ncbi:hypothetical protein Ddye_031889 [Dipteronia dyeriana]|uniref:Uncharacterized protein n=1 Tax=Dipteronia dyeriana TaxID=168575 RepID=A0AAD9WNW4_9ROSI|nr:hypothetical protein Ddye_031889 [Dipteronia dyeriana]